MAQTISLEYKYCSAVVWKIENFNLYGHFYSEQFNLLGSRWKFLFHRCSTFIEIYIMICGPILYSPFHTMCLVETQEQVLQPCQVVDVGPHGVQLIWCVKNELLEEYGNLLSGVVTFTLLYLPMDASYEGTVREHKSIQTSHELDHLSCLDSLSSDFSNLLVSGTQPDVMVKCGDHATPAHRLVLSARSEVFSAMFSSDMAEGLTGAVDIVDLDPSVLVQLLQYIYTGKVHNLTVDSAHSLYVAGDKYAVHELKNKCRTFLIENLNEETVYYHLLFSDIHSDQVLKDAAIEFFMNNRVLLVNDTWLKFSDNQPRLAIEVYRVWFSKDLNSSESTPAP